MNKLLNRFLPTAYVVRREGYVLTRVCLSVHTWGGGYPGQVQMGGGCTPARSDGGGGQRGTLGRSRQGVPQPGPAGVGYPTLGPPPPSDLARGVPLRGGGYPTSGKRWISWYAAVGMPLAFTQEDFLVRAERQQHISLSCQVFIFPLNLFTLTPKITHSLNKPLCSNGIFTFLTRCPGMGKWIRNRNRW